MLWSCVEHVGRNSDVGTRHSSQGWESSVSACLNKADFFIATFEKFPFNASPSTAKNRYSGKQLRRPSQIDLPLKLKVVLFMDDPLPIHKYSQSRGEEPIVRAGVY